MSLLLGAAAVSAPLFLSVPQPASKSGEKRRSARRIANRQSSRSGAGSAPLPADLSLLGLLCRRGLRLGFRAREQALGDHAMNALADVHNLADAAIRSHGRERVSLVAVEPFLVDEEIDGLIQRDIEGLAQVLVEADRDVMGLGLDSRE